MPRIQPYEQQIGPQGGIGGRRAEAGDLAPVGGLSAVVETVDRLANHYNGLRRDSLLSIETAKAQRELQEFSFTLQNGVIGEDGVYQAPPDPMQHQQMFDDKVKEITKRVKGSVDGEMYALFERDFSNSALRESFKVRENVIGQQRQAVQVEFQSNLTTLADIAADETDPGMQAEVRNKARLMTQRMVSSGVMSPEEGFKAEKSFDKMVVTAQVRRGMRDDPETTLQELLGDGFPQLNDPAEREKWIDQAGRRVDTKLKVQMAEEERTRRQEERAQKETEEATAKDGYKLATDGQLTTNWVEQNRDNLTLGDYKQLLETAKGKNVVSDPEVYFGLRDAAMKGVNVKERADLAFLNRQLSREDYDRILADLKTSGVIKTKGDSAGRDDVLKNGEDYIRTSLNAENPQTDSITRMRAAEAMDYWRKWRAENPNAKPEEARKVYKNIAEDATLLDDRGSVASLLPPRYMVGTMAAPDLSATMAATVKARNEGRIDESEYQQQLQLIKQWSDRAKKRPAKPAPSGKP